MNLESLRGVDVPEPDETDRVAGVHRRIRAAERRRGAALTSGVVAGVAIVAAVVLAHGSGGDQGRSTIVPGGPTASSAPSSPVPSVTPAAGPVQNVVADASVKAQLLAAYKDAKTSEQPGSVPADFTGPSAGTTYYAYDPSTDTHWAVATFGLTSTATDLEKVDMQDGGSMGFFHRTGDQPWVGSLGYIPFPCAVDIPEAVLAVWKMTPAPTASCGFREQAHTVATHSRVATSAELQAITTATFSSSLNPFTREQLAVEQVRLSDSDPTWATAALLPRPGHPTVQGAQAAFRQVGGAWTLTTVGAAVLCKTAPAQVQIDLTGRTC